MRDVRRKQKTERPHLGSIACTILRCGLPLVTAVLFRILYLIVLSPSSDYLFIRTECLLTLHYALTCLCIVVGGALYVDTFLKKESGDKQ